MPNFQGLLCCPYLNKTDLEQNVCNDYFFFFILFYISKFSKVNIYKFNKKKLLKNLAQISLYLVSASTHFQKHLKAFHFCIGNHIDDTGMETVFFPLIQKRGY